MGEDHNLANRARGTLDLVQDTINPDALSPVKIEAGMPGYFCTS
jgi:hypothetical protein